MDTVTAGFRTDIDNRVSDTGCCGIEDVVGVGQTHGHRIDQDIAVIGCVEVGFPTDGRDSHAVAVTADAFDDTAKQVAGFRMIRFAKAQSIEVCDRTGTHGEDIAHDAANTGCRTLIGFDKGRVVVAFHLEDGGLTIANVDDTSVFTRSLNDPVSLGRKGFEPFFR